MQPVELSGLKGVDRKVLGSLQKGGVETLEDLKLANMPQLCERTGLSEHVVREVLLRGELRACQIPFAVADALVASGAIGRVGELAAWDAEAIEALLEKAPKAGKGKVLGLEEIEALKARIPRLSLDEETTRGGEMEETTTALHDEREPALRAEEPEVSKRELDVLVARLEESVGKFSRRLRAITKRQAETVELASVQALVSSLQSDIQACLSQVAGEAEPGLEIVSQEDEAPALAEEEIEADVQIEALSQKLVTIKEQLAALQAQRIAGDEESSPTAAQEEEKPTTLRHE